jgi:hypothetical protein
MAQRVAVSPEWPIKSFFDALKQGLRVVAQKRVQAHLICPKIVGLMKHQRTIICSRMSGRLDAYQFRQKESDIAVLSEREMVCEGFVAAKILQRRPQRHRDFTEEISKTEGVLCEISVPLRLCGGFVFLQPLRPTASGDGGGFSRN